VVGGGRGPGTLWLAESICCTSSAAAASSCSRRIMGNLWSGWNGNLKSKVFGNSTRCSR